MKQSSAAMLVIWSTLALSGLWLMLGLYLFLLAPTLGTEWTRGELGDFVGGGLGAFAVLLVAYALLIQQRQIAEERVFRTIELLKPELENLSARIVAKAVGAGARLSEKEFEKLRDRFLELDRTVFFREIQRGSCDDALSDATVAEACERFLQVVDLIDESLSRLGRAGKNLGTAAHAMDFYLTDQHLRQAIALQKANSEN